MKKTQTLLLLFFLLIPALTVAQTSRISSNAGQQLRRYDPQMQSTEEDFGQDKLSVSFEKGIPLSTERALIRYITQHYRIALLIIGIYKLPGAGNLYFVTGTIYKDQQAQERSEAHTIFLVLREQGAIVSEVGKAEHDSDAAIKEPVFFLGRNKLLIIVSESAADGGFGGNYAFEYAANNLKSLGEIYVYDGRHGRGDWQAHSPMGRATAEYKNSTYHVTMRGVGSLYVHGNDKKIAPPGSPVTYFYDGAEWRPVAARQIRRR
jgi:hypothetical protein